MSGWVDTHEVPVEADEATLAVLQHHYTAAGGEGVISKVNGWSIAQHSGTGWSQEQWELFSGDRWVAVAFTTGIQDWSITLYLLSKMYRWESPEDAEAAEQEQAAP